MFFIFSNNIFRVKWNESGFRPPLCTYRLNWARRTSWGWWDDWDDTVLQTQDSKFEPWRSEAEHATSRSRRLPTILTFTRGWGRNIFVSLKPPRPGTEPGTLAWKAAVLTTTLGPPPIYFGYTERWLKSWNSIFVPHVFYMPHGFPFFFFYLVTSRRLTELANNTKWCKTLIPGCEIPSSVRYISRTIFEPCKAQYLVFHPFSAEIDFRRQNLTPVDVRIWRLKSTPHCLKWPQTHDLITYGYSNESERAHKDIYDDLKLKTPFDLPGLFEKISFSRVKWRLTNWWVDYCVVHCSQPWGWERAIQVFWWVHHRSVQYLVYGQYYRTCWKHKHVLKTNTFSHFQL